jgi:hypothetical protein
MYYRGFFRKSSRCTVCECGFEALTGGGGSIETWREKSGSRSRHVLNKDKLGRLERF